MSGPVVIIITNPPPPPPPEDHEGPLGRRRRDVPVPDGLSIADQLRAAADALDGE